MIKFYCDVCGEHIKYTDRAYYFKLWELSHVGEFLGEADLPFNYKRLICPECLSKLKKLLLPQADNYEMVDGRISKLKHPIDVCATDLNDMFLCDPDQPACEDWER